MATKKAKPEKVEEVIWRDITSYGGWLPVEQFKTADMLTMKTVGYLVSEDKKVVRIAQSLSDRNGQLGEMMVIPKSVIISRKKIR